MADLSRTMIAVLAAEGFDGRELSVPRTALERDGAAFELVSAQNAVDAQEIDAVLIGADAASAAKLSESPHARHFLSAAVEANKPIAAVGHGVALLLAADVLRGRTLTAPEALQGDIRDAGGMWMDEAVWIDGNLFTARGADEAAASLDKLSTFLEITYGDGPEDAAPASS